MSAKKRESEELVRVEPSSLCLPFDEMERWFREAFRRPFSLPRFPAWPRLRFPEWEEVRPSVDIFDENGNVVVRAELPGMTKDDIDVTLTENTLKISGSKKKEEKVEKKDYYRAECSFGAFTRRFSLPAGLETDKVQATFRDGLLEIKIPKTEEAKKKTKKVKVE